MFQESMVNFIPLPEVKITLSVGPTAGAFIWGQSTEWVPLTA